MYFNQPATLVKCKRLLPRAHLEQQRGSISQAIDYCHKDNDFYEFGTRPETPEEKGKRGREGLEERWKLAKEGRFEELPPENIRTYEYINAKYKPKPKRLEGPLLNEWIWGPTESGKTTKAEKENPGFYDKMRNKWWDGYDGEDVVLLEEIAPEHKELCQELKIWAQERPFRAEIKGGSIMIRPKKIVVTSNYRQTNVLTSLTFRPLKEDLRLYTMIIEIIDLKGLKIEVLFLNNLIYWPGGQFLA